MAQDDTPIENTETPSIAPHPIAGETYPPVPSTSEEPETVATPIPSRTHPKRKRQASILISFILVVLLIFAGWLTSARLGLISTTVIPTSTPNLTATAAFAGPTCVNGSITFYGSTLLYPLVNAVANLYQDACSGAAINAKQSGSVNGLIQVSAGTVDIGNSDIFADPSRYPGLTDHQVAALVFSVVLNQQVTGITNLTSQQLIDIYTGKITNWQDLGGPDLPIVTFRLPPGSGARITFSQYILNNDVYRSTIVTSEPPAGITSDPITAVKETSGAIGYTPTFYARQHGLTTIKIDGVSDADANVKNNSYKFWNLEHMYTKGPATGLTKAFIDYTSSNSSTVQNARQANGFLSISNLSSSAIATKQVTFQSTPTPTTQPTAK